MAGAYIVEALRTAGGRRNGRLAGWHPADMAGEILNALVERSGIDPLAVEDVIMGCVSQGGEQGFHIGRNAVLASRLPGQRDRRSRSIVSAGHRSRRCSSPHRR